MTQLNETISQIAGYSAFDFLMEKMDYKKIDIKENAASAIVYNYLIKPVGDSISMIKNMNIPMKTELSQFILEGATLWGMHYLNSNKKDIVDIMIKQGSTQAGIYLLKPIIKI